LVQSRALSKKVKLHVLVVRSASNFKIKAMSSPTSIPSSSSSSRKWTKDDDDDNDDDDFDSGDLESDYSSDDSEHQRHVCETHSEAQLKHAQEARMRLQRLRAASVPHLFTLALTPKDKDASTTTKKKKKKNNNKAPAYYTIDDVVTEVMSSLKATSTNNNTTNNNNTTTTTKKRVSSKKAASPTMSSLDIPPSVSKQKKKKKKKKKKTLPVKWQKLRASFKWVRSVGFF
jgi:hypothetical protein